MRYGIRVHKDTRKLAPVISPFDRLVFKDTYPMRNIRRLRKFNNTIEFVEKP